MLGQKCNDPPHLLLLHKFFPLLHINFVYSQRRGQALSFSALMPNISPFLGLVRAPFRPPRCLFARLLKDSEPQSSVHLLREASQLCADADAFKYVFPLIVAELWAAIFEFGSFWEAVEIII